MSHSVLKNDIDVSTFTDNNAYGSPNGHDYGCVGWLLKPVTMISLSVGDNAFGRIEFRKSDGMCITAGATDLPDKSVMQFQEDERFREVKLYTCSGRLVGLCLVTNRQTCKVFVKQYNPSASQSHVVEVGSGKCVGIFGNSGVWLESLGLAMLREDAKIGGGRAKGGKGGRK